MEDAGDITCKWRCGIVWNGGQWNP